MYGKQDCADKYINIAEADGKPILNAEQVQAAQSQEDGYPDQRRTFFLQKQAEYGHQYNVEGSDKACFPNGGVLDAKLLEGAGEKQADAADYPAGQQAVTTVDGMT